uniref:UspA domain-containing protein n=1 Tax=Rhizophora mucronata TaxID=61149 RepID=A0A2P2JEY7_RHIMU
MADGKIEGREKKEAVMVAIDGSECSHYALTWALENLKETISTSGLLVFTVQPIADFSYLSASTLGATHPDLVKSVLENQKKAALALLQTAKDICANHGVVAETLTEAGDPKVAICETANKLEAKLLVMGSHSRGAIQRAFLGSVSSYCVHHCKYPVLVVKQQV